MNNIIDLTLYTDSMRKTLFDKTFFVDKVNAQVFVDFGCGDGSLVNLLSQLFPDNFYIGYDNNHDMIELASKNNRENLMFLCNLSDVNYLLKVKEGKKCLILSSVIHEVYSYCTKEQIEEFYSFIYSNTFNYICIRDMMPSIRINNLSDSDDVRAIIQTLKHDKLETKESHLLDFEREWGSIIFKKNFYHFLLKYRYLVNWDRELHENYFPIYLETFKNLIPKSYKITYEESFILPFLKSKVYEDFGITLNEKTHIKLILENE